MISKPYTNSVGQTIQPGDKVVVIASGYSHSIHERVGTFVGVSEAGSPQVQVELRSHGYFKEDGSRGRWNEPGVKYVTRNITRVSTYYAGRVYKLA